MKDELGERERLRRYFAEVHAEETPPPFKKLIRPRKRQRPLVRKWATAAAVGLILVGAWALRDFDWKSRSGPPPPTSAELALARSLSWPEAPLDFLLATPGSELLTAPPRLTGDWHHLTRIEFELGSERKETI